MLGPSRTVDGTSKTRYPLDTQGGHRERVVENSKKKLREVERAGNRKTKRMEIHTLPCSQIPLACVVC